MKTKLKLKVKLLCDDEESRRKGLMKVDDLQDDECAFFIMPRSSGWGFWNKDVNYDLTLACVNDKFKIQCFLELSRGSTEPRYPKTRDAKYVVEAKKGIFVNNGVKENDYVDFDPDKRLLLFLEGENEHDR